MSNQSLTNTREGWSLEQFCKENKLEVSPGDEVAFVAGDTETTGLNKNPDRPDRILEIGILLLDDWLRVVDVYHSYVWDSEATAFALAHMDSFAFDMHSKSGLLTELLTAAGTADPFELEPSEVEKSLLDFLMGGVDEKAVPMLGSTVRFDRNMIAQEMPNVDEYLHHRSVDVSSLKELAKLWNPDVHMQRPNADATKPHRALLDVAASVRELMWYRDTFLVVDGVE
jgi:oligoribonuclease